MKKLPKGSFFISVLPAGIEPTLQAPQACVLSVERREQISLLSDKKKHTVKILKVPVGGARLILQGVLLAAAPQGNIRYPQQHLQAPG